MKYIYKLQLCFTIYFMCGILVQCRANVTQRQSQTKHSSGSMISEIAKELFERTKNAKQVFNVNLSNFLLILLLKSVVFGANYIGNSDHKSREIEENILSEEEIALGLGYLVGDTCLYRAACEVPETAKNYLGAYDMIIQTMKLMPQTLPFNKKYEQTVTEFRKAIEYGDIKQCPPEYSCKKENIKNFLRPE